MPATPTINVTIGPAWGLLVDDGLNFLLTLKGSSKVKFAASATATEPTVAVGHPLVPMRGESLARFGNMGPCPPGYIYGRLENPSDAPVLAALDAWAA